MLGISTRSNSPIINIKGESVFPNNNTSNKPEHIHRNNLQRLKELGMSPVTLTKTKFDISDECANQIICELRDMFYSTQDESLKNTLIDELQKYKKELETIEDIPNYPNSIDIKIELSLLIQK